MLLDRFHYGAPVPRGHWAAIVLIIAAQAYLLLAPAGTPPSVARGAASAMAQVETPSARHRA